jgi:pyrroline-5-carboxylate reductase
MLSEFLRRRKRVAPAALSDARSQCDDDRMSVVAVLGAGVMGETLVSGLLRAGRRPEDLIVTERRPDRADELRERYGVDIVSNAEAAQKADTLLLVVKPQDMAGVLDDISSHLTSDQLVVSLAAGITTATVEARLPEGVPVVRVMPNTPALVDEGMAAISGGRHSTESHLVEAETLLRSTGRVLRVPEQQQDAVTAISGSGPAYIFFVVESMIEAGVHLGLPRPTATELAVQTVVGSAKLLRETGEHPVVLRERVTSPGGTTAAALRELEDHKVRAAFLTAAEAARNRSRALAADQAT